MPNPGHDVTLVDVPAPRGAPTDTSTLFLVDFAGAGPFDTPTLIQSPEEADSIFELSATPAAHSKMQAVVDTYFALGGSQAYLVRTGGDARTDEDDDHEAIDADNWTTSLASIGASLGPGQIVAPAATTAALAGQLIDHAATRNRFALINPPSGANDSALTTLAGALTTLNGRFAALWRDYATIPGRVYGTTRTVPWTAVQAGLIARADSLSGNPNQEAAGIRNGYGIAGYVQAIVDEVTDTRRTTLKNAQVNTAKSIYGQSVAYGIRTLADLDALAHWWNVGGSRTVMAARALIAQVDEAEVFGQIDGQGHALAFYNGALRGVLLPLHDIGALFGDTPADAFRVDTGPSVNTVTTIANGEKRARVALKTSPGAEHVITFLARVAIDQVV